MDAVLPQDLAEAHALIERLTASLAEKDAALSHRDDEIERLERILDKYIRRQYGRRSEQLPPEQMALGLEDLETGIAAARAKAESQDATRVRRHGSKRGALPDHLPRIEIVIEPETKSECRGNAVPRVRSGLCRSSTICSAGWSRSCRSCLRAAKWQKSSATASNVVTG